MKNTIKNEAGAIRTRPHPNCYICGTKGNVLYKGLKDRLFGSKGEWNLKVCPDTDCGFVWLDPMPFEEDLSKIYINYYTHQQSISDRKKNKLLVEMLRWNVKLVVSFLKRITLIHRERKRIDIMYLHNTRPGRLLEVGCGAGHLLAKLRSLGWKTEGQEVDSRAAENARNFYDFPVHLGALEDLSLPENSFDAIIMNHVVEHVHDPTALLTECYRILRPNGRLTVTTPNNNSYGHRYFKSCWCSLDAPRHLYLFSSNSLRQTAIISGFKKLRIWTTSARIQPAAVVSFEIKHNRSYHIDTYPKLSNDIKAMLFQIWARIMQIVKLNSGEECVLIAEK